MEKEVNQSKIMKAVSSLGLGGNFKLLTRAGHPYKNRGSIGKNSDDANRKHCECNRERIITKR